MARLDASRLAALPATVRRPSYEPARHGVGIVHLGLGAFHRAHQACYVDDMLGQRGGNWRISGISCRSSAVREQLAPQDGLYCVAEQSAARTDYRVVGSIADVLVAPENPAAARELLAQPTVHLITLTVTEKAYQRPQAAGASTDAIGLLADSLQQRRHFGIDPPTLLCCDNLRDNGEALRIAVLDAARTLDPSLPEWIDRCVRFPNSMVDRIVPATTAAARDEAAQVLGVRDEALVTTEPFSQWIIEDHFSGPRPPLEMAGVRFVPSVRPYELAKLRLLNGSHSTLAYVGLLAGDEYVHQAIANAGVRALVQQLMREASVTLAPTAGLDVAAYQQQLLLRFGNPAVRHRLSQVAMDGSQKLPQRLLPPLRDHLAQGKTPDAMIFALASWMVYVARTARHRDGAQLDDPLRRLLVESVQRAAGTGVGLADALLDVDAIFGELRSHTPLRAALGRQIQAIEAHGVMPALQSVLARFAA